MQLASAGVDHINTIIQSSRKRGDELHVELERLLSEDDNLTIRCHRNCVSSYTSSSHISRHLKRQGKSSARSSSEPSPLKRTRRSEVPGFKLLEHCLFCGEHRVMDHDPRNPSRWRIVRLCRTADRGAEKETFTTAILKVCEIRKDKWAGEVQGRLEFAISDLHAADARYHEDATSTFIAPLVPYTMLLLQAESTNLKSKILHCEML
jgi:hypothetical protein